VNNVFRRRMLLVSSVQHLLRVNICGNALLNSSISTRMLSFIILCNFGLSVSVRMSGLITYSQCGCTNTLLLEILFLDTVNKNSSHSPVVP